MTSETGVQKRSMRRFMIIMLGQLFSLVGSGVMSFALGVWLYSETGQAMPFAITALVSILPRVLIGPFAGALVDRWNRKRVMIISDLLAACVTVILALLIYTDSLLVWHIYLGAGLIATFGTFQDPALTASVTMLVEKEDFARAAGFRQGVYAMQTLLAPLLAGALYGLIGLRGIVFIDLAAAAVAISILLAVTVPQPEETEEGKANKGTIIKEAASGFSYIFGRPGLASMLIYFAFVNFFANASGILLTPLVLSFADAGALGITQTVGGVGMLLGSLLMGVWKGFKKKITGVYVGIALAGVGFGILGLRPLIPLIAFGQFFGLFFIPIANAMAQAIWQTKVAPDMQGRVFATRSVIAISMMPFAYLLSGTLADNVFEPMMLESGALAGLLGPILGVGPGRGVGVMFMMTFVLLLILTLLAWAYPGLRNVEADLPDFDPKAALAEADTLAEATLSPAD